MHIYIGKYTHIYIPACEHNPHYYQGQCLAVATVSKDWMTELQIGHFFRCCTHSAQTAMCPHGRKQVSTGGLKHTTHLVGGEVWESVNPVTNTLTPSPPQIHLPLTLAVSLPLTSPAPLGGPSDWLSEKYSPPIGYQVYIPYLIGSLGTLSTNPNVLSPCYDNKYNYELLGIKLVVIVCVHSPIVRIP